MCHGTGLLLLLLLGTWEGVATGSDAGCEAGVVRPVLHRLIACVSLVSIQSPSVQKNSSTHPLQPAPPVALTYILGP